MMPESAIGLTLGSSVVTIIAGESVEQQFSLTNLTPTPGTFQFAVEGFPATWCHFMSLSSSLYTNQSDLITFRLEIPAKTRPERYFGYIVVSERNQSGLRTKAPIEIAVLAPLKLEAHLRPHRASGFKASYDLLLRNTSMCDTQVKLALLENNSYCQAEFTPGELVIPKGQRAISKIKVGLRSKTPEDIANQFQKFNIEIQPQWIINNTARATPATSITGEYKHNSRWAFVERNRRLLFLILLPFALWLAFLLIGFLARLWLIGTAELNANYTGVAASAIWVDQNRFTDKLQVHNPLSSVSQVQVRFREPDQKVEINLKIWWFTSARLEGRLLVDSSKGNLIFQADDPNQPGSFPWFLLPPDELVQRLNIKLKRWLIPQRQRMFDSRIEGNTVFIRVRPCIENDPACV